jgi:glycosyltransferase involved in cell wall biosynthesis
MKILLVDREFPPNPHGGIGTYHLTLARALGERDHSVVALSSTVGRAWERGSYPFGLVLRFPYQPPPAWMARHLPWLEPLWFGWQCRSHLASVGRSIELDLVELPSAGGTGWGAVQVCCDQAPVVTRFHGCLGRLPVDSRARVALRSELQRAGIGPARFGAARRLSAPVWWLERYQMAHSDRLTFPSAFSREWLAGQLDGPEPGGPVIPNGIDLAALRPSAPPTLAPRIDGGRLIVFVGRCTVPKGATVLARAAPGILAHAPEAILVFAGPLPDPRVAAQLGRLSDDFPGRVRLTGHLPHRELLELVSVTTLLVHPTFYEICPMAVLEAQGLRVPVVASDCGPLPELVADGITGLLFPPGDATALAESVLTLLGSTPTRRALGEAARARMARHFEIGRVVDQLIAFYRVVAFPGQRSSDEIS